MKNSVNYQFGLFLFGLSGWLLWITVILYSIASTPKFQIIIDFNRYNEGIAEVFAFIFMAVSIIFLYKKVIA
jgi:hypothetical protein